ncbi:MAG: cupin-like domain-containing protein [Xanthomonadales bacterium]|nr:cupin-like domain-containing protein [Xanthomonadales bacterium]
MSTNLVPEFNHGQAVDARSFPLAEAMATAQPWVLRGLCRDWPLVQAATRSVGEFAHALASMDNGATVNVLHIPAEAQGVVGFNASLDGFNYKHFKVTITDVLQRLAAYTKVGGPTPGVALQSARVSECMPTFFQAHALPCLPDSVQPRLWLGNTVTTPAHVDASHNIAVVACGRRRFTVFPVEQVANLYIGPLDFAPTEMPITMARPDAPDFDRHPKLRDALEHALVADLLPGDALYLPPLWWHHVQSFGPLNALVNYWWSAAPASTLPELPPIGALLHAVLAFGQLPQAERRRWGSLFEHYVFGDNDPAEHLPDHRRGVLGPMSAEAETRLRERIKGGF